MDHTATNKGAGAKATGRKWTDWPGWDYVPGVAFMAIGAFALTQPLLVTSLATSIAFGAMLFVCGAFSLAGGLVNIGHRGGWLVALLGVLSIVVGWYLMYNPIGGAISLVWVAGMWLIVGGALELALAFSIPVGRAWLVLLGLTDLALGVFLEMMDPVRALAFLGFFVGFSLVFRGLWSVLFVSDAHQHHRSASGV